MSDWVELSFASAMEVNRFCIEAALQLRIAVSDDDFKPNGADIVAVAEIIREFVLSNPVSSASK